MMQQNTVIRQGDVLIERIEKMPDQVTEVPPEDGRVILAHGERTGHAHAFSRTANVRQVVDETNQRFLRIGGGGAVLQHEEHGHITLEAGDYKITRQVEYSPEEIRNVAD